MLDKNIPMSNNYLKTKMASLVGGNKLSSSWLNSCEKCTSLKEIDDALNALNKEDVCT